LADITTIRITKDSHREILKIMGEIQARTGMILIFYTMLQMKYCN